MRKPPRCTAGMWHRFTGGNKKKISGYFYQLAAKCPAKYQKKAVFDANIRIAGRKAEQPERQASIYSKAV
ncbi:hypothetical protein [Neisseria dentiae]|uniref:hypothetical protein n=1 Tax=Neisseria dentiae TaxID=194197 RepID=UPI0035A113B7